MSQCAQLRLDGMGALDAVLVIDASRSTRNSSESDIDGDGEIGRFKASAMTDPDDTWLSAQVAGVRSLVHAASGPDRRFSIVSFSGRFRFGLREAPAGLVLRRQAVVQSGLTEDLESLEAGLVRVLEKGSFGTTDFAAGLHKALRALSEAAPAPAASRRLILFMSTAPTPLVPGPNEKMLRIDPSMKHLDSKSIGAGVRRMKHAALSAVESGVSVHTFGLGEAAATPPPHALSQIAGSGGGSYRAVSDPALLHCYLLHALVP
ncbi:MAG: vWA domain-containing protein [Myxococcota bacterium]